VAQLEKIQSPACEIPSFRAPKNTGVPMPVLRRKLLSPPTSIAPPSSDQRVRNVKAAAKYLCTSVWQIRKYIREGALPSFRIGNKVMLDTRDLDKFIDQLKAA
jgi:excisionase family DNA binding protein